jgi:phosphomannomutase
MNNLNLTMFRAYDIRTPSEQLSGELAARLCRAEAVYFRETLGVSGVLAAHDARSTGPGYLQIGAEEFTRAGLDVVVVPGVCSTSQFYFAAMRHPDMAAVMFGASHNPAGDTGQKILGPGVRPIAARIGPKGGLDKIRELYATAETPPPHPPLARGGAGGGGRITAYDPTDEYIRYSMKLAGVEPGGLRGLKVFHDYLNGAAGREMMLAFARAGADLRPLHFAADGRFPLGDPNPVKQTVIREGWETLKAGDFRLGTFFDGDGDRIDFYRGDGSYLSSSFVYAGILPYIRERFPGPGMGVYADLKSNPLAVMEMAKTGVTVNVIRNGHSQIKNTMFENPAMFGTVEESAHFYEAFMLDGGRYCTENSLYVALLAARAWQENPARFERLFEIQTQTGREREWGYKFPTDAQRAAALSAVEEHFVKKGARAMNRMSNGYDLEATMMRRGLPFDIDASTRLEPDWLQVCQRISQSENGLARWEVVAADTETAATAKRAIAQIVRRFGAGEEYQG